MFGLCKHLLWSKNFITCSLNFCLDHIKLILQKLWCRFEIAFFLKNLSISILGSHLCFCHINSILFIRSSFPIWLIFDWARLYASNACYAVCKIWKFSKFLFFRVLFAISFTASTAGWAAAYFPEYSKARLAAGKFFYFPLGVEKSRSSVWPKPKKGV